MERALSRVLEERRAAPVEAPRPREPTDLLDHDFAPQTAFVVDPARLKVLLCTRRAGKSYGIAIDFLRDAATHPRANYLYVGLTKESAKKAIWKDALKEIDREMALMLDFSETDLTCTLPNGAVVYVLGFDSSEKQREKARGGKYRRVAIDEAQSFGSDLRALVNLLRPTLTDDVGTLEIAGTPGIVHHGLFFDLTHDQRPEQAGTWTRDDIETAGTWSGHRWSASDNPHIRVQWAAEIATMLAVSPRVVEVPSFQRERLGRWVIDDENLVYRYASGRNDYGGTLPKLPGAWHYVLGCDLGFNDPTAFVVCAYHDHDRTLYVVEASKRSKMDLTDVADNAKRLDGVYRFDAFVVDGANKQAVEEMKRRHDVPWIAADKTGKSDFIEIMNAEFILGRIKIDPIACATLVEEYGGLIWDERVTTRRVEHPASPNHGSDALLYSWRWCYQWASETPKPPPARGTPEWMQTEAESMEAEAEDQSRRARDAEREGMEWT